MNTNLDSGIKLLTLPNGFRVVMERLPYLHSASFGVWIKAGSAAESAREAGLAHFLEHLFFKGTRSRSVHQIMDAVESKGGYLNAGTSREYTTLYVRMLEKHVDVGVDVLGDILLNSTFCDLEKERNVILEEIASIEDTPDELSHDLLSEFHWPDHPLGRPVSGYANTVESMGKEDVLQFYSTWYKPENMVFAIAGNFDEDAVFSQVEKVFTSLPSGAAPAMDTPPSFQSGVKMVERPISQAHIGIAMTGPTATDDERYACNLLTGILGGGGTSRLFEKIREDEGLAYNVYAYHSNHINAGMMGVYEAVAPHNCGRALDLTFKELDAVRKDLVSIEELERCREQLKGSLLMALESTHARTSRMAKSLLFKGEITPVEEIISRIDAVTAEDLLLFARKHIQQNSCALLLLGPEDSQVPDSIPL